MDQSSSATTIATSSERDIGIMNGLTDNDQVGMGVVKKSTNVGQYRSSASSQGSSMRGELTLLRDSSSSTSSADEDNTHQINMEKRRKKSRKQRSVIHHPIDDDDDERTDSADEEEEGPYGGSTHPPLPQSSTSYSTGSSGMTFDPTSSILKPLSPSVLAVGYGAELMMTRPQLNQRDYSVPIMGGSSPHPSDGHVSSGNGGLSPEQQQMTEGIPVTASDHQPVVTTDGTGVAAAGGGANTVLSLVPTTIPSLSSAAATLSNGGGGAAVLNPTSSMPTAANALPFAGWWGQHATPIYSPFCGPSGSVATTPVATDSSGLYRPGTSVILRAVVCQESDGVLIVNVHWRNKSYSGSLIDVSQHQWAPPRLLEGLQEMPIEVKDLYSKQESEKEPVDVVIDEEKDEDLMDTRPSQTESNENDKIPSTAVTTGSEILSDVKEDDTSSEVNEILSSAVSKAVGSSADNNGSSAAAVVGDMIRPPNGLKVPPANVVSTGIADKLKPTLLPPFDSVKSPQPQIGREDVESSTRKKDSASDSPNIPETHNLNTLVDVAATMKHVSNEPTGSQSRTGSNNNATASTPGAGGGTGLHAGGKAAFTTPVRNQSDHDSDSSGSGSISPVRRQQQQQQATTKEVIIKGTVPPGEDIATHSATHLPPPPHDVSSSTNQPFHHNNTVTPSGGVVAMPSSPDRHDKGTGDDRQKRSSSNKQMSHPQWVPPPMHPQAPPTQLEHKEMSKKRSSSPMLHHMMGMNNKPPPGILPGTADHSQSPLFSHPPSSVIQDKSYQQQQQQYSKRKRPMASDVSKRPSPPPRERANSPATIGTHSSASSVFHKQLALVHGQEPRHDQLPQAPPPPGFQFDPSLPMSYHLQVVSYTQEKAMEAAASNRDRNTPPNKIAKRSHPPHDHTSSTEHTRSPPSHHYSNSNSMKRQSNTITSGGGTNSTSTSNKSSVVMQSDRTQHISGLVHQSQPIKQEILQSGRPARPSSKGGIPSSHAMPTSSRTTSSSSSHSSRKGQHPSRRPEHPSAASIMIKQEPVDHGLGPPPGSHPLLQPHAHHFPFTFPVVISSTPSSTMSPHAQWTGSVISNSSVASSQTHRKTPSDLVVPRTTNRTPSPAPQKKQPDWATTHSMSNIQQAVNIKHESGTTPTSRHSSSGMNMGGDKHSNSIVSNHGPSSSRGHHSNKHDGSSSSRHVITPSHSIPPAAAQTLSPSYIQDLRNGIPSGVQVDWMKQMQLMQLEALHKGGGGIVGAAPPTAAAIPTHIHPQELALWQNQMAAAQMAAMQQLPLEQQATALQMQLALQQQQQQNEAAAVTAFTTPGLFPLMQPFPVGAQAVLPFPLAQPPNKRDT